MTAGKDTADLIYFEQTSSLHLNAIYKQRAKDDMHACTRTHTHTHTHTQHLSLSQVGPRHTHFSVGPTRSKPCFSTQFAENKYRNTSGSKNPTSEDL